MSWWVRVPAVWRRAVVAALALRVAASLVAVLAAGILPAGDPVGVPPAPGFRGWPATQAADRGIGVLGAGLERQDALWYLAIARDGYPDGPPVPAAAAFMPGYPLLVGVLGRATGGRFLLAGSLLALAATVAAFAGLQRLAEQLTGADSDSQPRQVLLAAALFPTAFFLVAPYPESLFLAASTWALVAILRGRWRLAAILGAGAAATRPVGILLAGAFVVEGFARRSWRLAVAAAGPLAGLLAVLSAGWVRWGTWVAPLVAQGGWQRELRPPWWTLSEAVRLGLRDPWQPPGGYWLLDLVVVVPVVVAVGWLVARSRPSLAIYALLHLSVWLVLPFPPRPLLSVPRFALGVAPVFLAFAAGMGRREATWAAVSGGLLALHAALFVTWHHVF